MPRLVLAALSFLALAPAAQARPTVVIHRTSYGIPRIWATSYVGAGEAYGYAFAQDDLCTIAADYITVDAQRSRFFGPDGSYLQGGNGVTASNLDSDFFFQQIIDSKVIDKLLAQPAPFGPEPAVRQLVTGYVKGYNRYLRKVGGSGGVPDSRCRGQRWVRPISQADVWRRFYQLIELASGDVVIQGIAEAAPPAPAGSAPSLSPDQTAHLIAQRLPRGALGAVGSNAVAIGRGGARDHTHGVLLGNPHFPWIGTERFYQAQIDIPGRMHVEGASLFGVPLVLIGHTPTVAWSHTVSTAFRFTPYQLTLVPGSPTTYLYDGQPQQMTSRTVTVGVRQPDGTVKPQSRTLYSSRFGPIFNTIEGVPLPWTPTTAFALADANADNFRVFNHFIDVDRARSAPQVLSILNRYEGIPWVNTIVADRQGNALYADIGTVPNVPNSLASQCNTVLGSGTFQLLGLPILDGSRSACNWATDSDAVKPGIFGRSHLPHLFRSDYVTNSNDSYWLSNPHQPLTGFARIIGTEGTARTLRTRIGLIMTQARVDGSDHLGPPGFTARDMQNMVFSDRQHAGELTRDALVSMCRSFPGGMAPTSGGATVAVGSACDILARWDLHETLGSKGAVLFRRFWDHADAATVPTVTVVSPFANPFDPNDPVHTPNGLNTSAPTVRNALGDAINDLQGAHIPLDAAPGDVQRQPAPGGSIPIHGGTGDPNGEFNAIYTHFTAGQGFSAPYTGSSFVQVVSWNSGPCPLGGTILTYSESDNPTSRHHSDQTRLFSRKQWVPDTFCPSAIKRDTKSTMVLERGR
ncbi:MAG TPA: penicillin acylase family protein [Solirubrobacteraceae bacterium]|nr:penicillin acylase family protein [Solirubrobacteraceae bacterium]